MAAPLINLKGLNKFDAFKLISRQLPKIGLHPDILNKHSNEVSFGQLQRLCLLKSLIIKPNLLLCDEITASLDPLSARECLKLIKEYQNALVAVRRRAFFYLLKGVKEYEFEIYLPQLWDTFRL